MLDGLLGRGFVPKGKSLIKLTKNRIDVLRRKRNATIKFLKRDLADLLANGLDVNAYGRAGGLLDELRLLWNLDFVEKSCDFVYKHLSIMQKMRECPEDCREAVSSLMFAASGFSELPELRDLRHIFHEKYGDLLELFVNQEFVENLSSKPFSMEKKVNLMADVTSEFCIQWDAEAFEKRISRHNGASVKDLNKNYGSPHAPNSYKATNEYGALPKIETYDSSSKERSERSNKGHSLNRHADAPERRDPIIQPAKEIFVESQMEDPLKIFRYGPRGEQHGFSSRERKETVYSECRSESKDNEKEKSELCFQSRQAVSGKRHEPHSNNTDTTNVKHNNYFQGNWHQNVTEHESKKAEDFASRAPKPTSFPKRTEKFDFGFKQENFFQGYRQVNCPEQVPQQLEVSPSRTPAPGSSSKRMEDFDQASRCHNGWGNRENAIPVGESPDGLLNGRPENFSAMHDSKSRHEDPFGANHRGGGGGEYDYAKSVRKLKQQEMDRPNPYFNNALPPPYVKPKGKAKNIKLVEPSSHLKAGSDGNSIHEVSFNCGTEVAQAGNSHPEIDSMKNPGHHVDSIENLLPRRRSSRKKHSKSSSGDVIADTEDPNIDKKEPRNRRRENSRKGLQILFDDDFKKDEEKIIDKLLMHYSQKPSSYEEITMKRESESRRSRRTNAGSREGGPGSDDMSKIISQPSRSLSLPSEQTGPSSATKMFGRAASFQIDRSSKARHVHPNLPDYDDLAARFAALKGR